MHARRGQQTLIDPLVAGWLLSWRCKMLVCRLQRIHTPLVQAHLDAERVVVSPPHRKRFLPLWVGYVGRRSPG